MSSSSLAKKLCLAKKAWRVATTTIQSKFHKFKTSKVVKTTTRRLLRMFSFRFHFPFKRQKLARPSYQYGQQRYHCYHYNQVHANFAAIHIDDLFEEPVPAHAKTLHAHAGTSKGKEVVDEKSLPKKSTSINTIDDAWKAVVASSPHLRGVDERAEDFISKFHEEMKIQKERSLLEFQEMLARSA